MRNQRPQKTKHEIARVFLYARVSTSEQAEKDLSLPAQIDAMRSYCQRHKYEIIREFVEPGRSGRDDNRPEFGEMVHAAMASDSNVDAIIVFHSSRFMRNVGLAQFWKAKLRKFGVRVVSTQMDLADDPTGRYFERNLESIDELESDLNSTRTRAAMRQNAKLGYLNGSTAPYGFMAKKVEVGRERFKRKLVPNPQEAEIVREACRLYVGGLGALAVAQALNAKGLWYRDNTPWDKDRVLNTISNSALIGTYFWGKRNLRDGLTYDAEEWIEIAVEPIVDRELFDLVRAAREQREPRKNPGRTGSSPLLLAGLVKCGACGASFQLETSGKPDATGERPHRYYNCRSYLREGRGACRGCRLPEVTLDDAVIDHITNVLFDEERCRAILQALAEQSTTLRDRVADQRKQVQTDLGIVEKAITRWVAAFESGQDVEDLGAERLRELKAKKTQLTETLNQLRAPVAVPGYLQTTAALRSFQAKVRQQLKDSNGFGKTYLRVLLDAIVVTDGHVELRVKPEAVAGWMDVVAKERRGEDPLNREKGFSLAGDGGSSFGVEARTFSSAFVIDLAAYRKRKQTVPLRTPAVIAMLVQAEGFQVLLNSGEVERRTDLARRFGLSRPRVTQLLNLLKLDRSIRAYIRSLGPGSPLRAVTEKGLRRTATLPREAQVEWARAHLPGFARFLKQPKQVAS